MLVDVTGVPSDLSDFMVDTLHPCPLFLKTHMTCRHAAVI